jgi:hypothetical protein
MFNWNDEDILYKPELLTIVEYIPNINCYRAKAFFSNHDPSQTVILQQIGGVSPFTDSANGKVDVKDTIISKHALDNTQNTYIYSPQTAVIALVPRSIDNNPVDQLVGFIIGKISTPFFYKNVKDGNPTVSEIQDINVDSVYEKVNKLNQTSAQVSVKNNLNTDLIPGDSVQRGLHTYTLMDNYIYTFGTDLTKTCHCSITGELTDTCLLKQEYTAISEKTSYIVGDSPIQINKYSYNINDSLFDCIGNTDQTITIKQDPLYLYVEAAGELIDGRTDTQYIKDSDEGTAIPVYQKKVSMEGAYRLHSTKRLTLKKTVENDFDIIECAGAHFKPEGATDLSYLRAVEPPIKDTFASESEPFSKTPENAVAFMDILEDGSITLKDAWGSYIKLKNGNIQIHAANDLFFTANRDVLSFAGGMESRYASKGIELDTNSESDIMIRAGENFKVKSNNIALNSNTCGITSTQAICCDSPTIGIATKSEAPANLLVGNVNTNIHINSNMLNVQGNKEITAFTAGSCISLYPDKRCQIYANTEIAGDISIGATSKQVTVKTAEGSEKYEYNATNGNIYLQSGSLYANGTVSATVGITSDYVAAHMVASSSGKIANAGNVSTSSTKTILQRHKPQNGKSITIDAQPLSETIWDNFNFEFKSTGSNSYLLEESENIGTVRAINTEGGYVYPGKSFWENNGITHLTIDENGNEKEEIIGFSKYLYN